MLKYIIPKCWGNFSSFGFYSVGFVCGEKPNVLKCAAGFQLVGNGQGYAQCGLRTQIVFSKIGIDF